MHFTLRTQQTVSDIITIIENIVIKAISLGHNLTFVIYLPQILNDSLHEKTADKPKSEEQPACTLQNVKVMKNKG